MGLMAPGWQEQQQNLLGSCCLTKISGERSGNSVRKDSEIGE